MARLDGLGVTSIAIQVRDGGDADQDGRMGFGHTVLVEPKASVMYLLNVVM